MTGARDPSARPAGALFAGKAPQLAGIAALMALSALCEGVGLLLFVPMLAALGGAPIRSGRLAHLFALTGVPTTIGPLLVLFVILAVVRAMVNYARDIAQFDFQHAAVDGLRRRAWAALVRCDWRTLAQMRRSEGANLLLTEVELAGRGIEQMFVAIGTLMTLAGLALAAVVIAPAIAIGALAAGAVAVVVYRRMQRRTMQLGERIGAAARGVHEEFDEGLAALRVIKSFGAEERAIATGNAAVGALRGIQAEFYRTVGFGAIAIQGGGAALLALLVWFAVTRWGAGTELILPLVALSLRALPLLPVLHHCWQAWIYARPAIARSAAMIETAEAAREPDPSGDPPPPLLREVALGGVGVRYAGRDRAAIEGIDLTLPAHSITALLGPSGAGKSTIADVLGGLVAPDAGTLAIDGVALGAQALRNWRPQVAYVQQDPWLFPGSIRENLLWADPAADEARLHAVLGLAAAGFVEALPDGIDTRVGDNGRALSGGERQRIVLARALLREPQLLILDEATSALDAATETAIAEAVSALRARMTILVIGHRGRLTDLADRTIRIEGGRIEGGRIVTTGSA
jgi:ATP-binding cassette subfamily C protein